MKLIPDYDMNLISSINASSQAIGYSATNLKYYDPGLIWKPTEFASDASIVIDFSAQVETNALWINNANFTQLLLQANSVDTWDSPALSFEKNMSEDEKGVVKGFFELPTFEHRYIRIVIPVQDLLFAEIVPFLGNVIVGRTSEISVASWNPSITQEWHTFKPDGGPYMKTQKANPRHIFGLKLSGTKSELDSAPLKNWHKAVIYTDLGDVSDSYLVHSPVGRAGTVRNLLDCEINFSLEEMA